MRTRLVGMLASCAAAAWFIGAAGAQDAKEPQKDPSGAGAKASGFSIPGGTGATPEMKAMAWLAGRWAVKTTYFGPDGKAYPTSETEAVIEPMLGGSFLREEITVSMGPTRNAMMAVRSYDRFRKVYRWVWFDSVITLADVFEGEVRDGALTVTDVKSGTSYAPEGMPEAFAKITQREGATRDSFVLIWEASNDKGATWRKTAEYAYTRKP